VAEDQFGSPTYVRGLAHAILRLIELELRQPTIYHWCDAGGVNWLQFAQELQRQARTMQLLDHEVPIKEIPFSEYPGLALRPRNGVLDGSHLAERLGFDQASWRRQLHRMVRELANTGETRA